MPGENSGGLPLPEDMSEEEFVSGVRAGDAIAWQWVDSTIRPWLDREANGKCGNPSIAEEAADLVSIWLAENRSTFDPRSLRAVLRTRVRLMVHTLLGSRDRRHGTNADWLTHTSQSAKTPIEVAEANELMARLEAAVSALPRQQRRAFILIKLEGRTYAETAATMELSKKTVENYVRAAVATPAMQAFEALLRRKGEDDGESQQGVFGDRRY